MAQVDTSIYANLLRPPKTVEEYDAEAQQAKARQLQNLLGQAQYDNQLREVANEQKLSGLYQNALNPNGSIDRSKLISGAASNGLGYKIPGLQKQLLDLEEGQAKVDNQKSITNKNNSETLDQSIKRYRGALDYIDTPRGAIRWLQAQYTDPVMAQHMQALGSLDEAIKHIPQNPAEFQQWRRQAGMGMEAYAKKVQKDQEIAETARDNKVKNGIAQGQLGVAQGQLGVARERLTLDKQAPKGQIVQTDQGTMVVDPRTGNVVPAIGPGGVPLTKPLKDIPANVNTAIITNAQNLNKINQAIDLLDGKTVGSLKGDKEATGWKGYASQGVLNRLDPNGVDTRAMISDIGSLVLHDRSGAAVTASESPRLMPFIPLATDDAATAKKKLTRFKQLYEQEQQAFAGAYSQDQGYRPSPVKPTASTSPGGGLTPEAIAAELKRRGH